MTDIKAMRCPSCGGPIQFEEDDSLTNCPFCGVQVHRPEGEKPYQPIPVRFEIPIDEAKLKRNTGIGLVIAILIPILIFGLVFAIVASTMASEAPFLQPGAVEEGQPIKENQIYTINEIFLVDEGPPVFLVTAYLKDSTHRYIYLDFSAESPERWRSDALPDEYYRAEMFVDDKAFYIVFDAELYALSRTDGAELWRAKLSDDLASPCERCLRIIDTKVIVLLKDGQLSAYERTDGQKSWGVMLNEPTRTLVVLDGKPAVWDQSEDGAVLRLFDLASGQEARVIAPNGPNEPFPDDPQTPNIYSPLYVDQDGVSFYTLFGTFEPLSIQRWDARSGEMLWQATAPEDFSRNDLDNSLLSQGYLFVVDDGDILALETASGALQVFEAIENYELIPLASQENRLLVVAKRQRGTSRDELWAFDIPSGNVAWKVVPEAEKRMEYPSGFVDNNGSWVVHLVNGGVILMEYQNDPIGMTWRRIDLVGGASDAQKTMLPPGQKSDSTSLYLNPLLWQNEDLWYAGDNLYLVDLEAGQSTIKWP